MHPLQVVFIAIFMCVLAFFALKILGWGLRRYTYLPELVMSRGADDWDDDASADDPPYSPAATSAATAANPIATLQTERNALLHGNDLDPIFAAKIEALVDALAARQGTQTELIKAIFKVNPSGSSEKYKSIVAAIKAEQDRRQVHATPIAGRPTDARFRKASV